MTAEIINFMDYKKKQGPDIATAKILAKKIVDAYRNHGEDAYYRAIVSATKGDQEAWDFLRPFVEEVARRAKVDL